MIFYGNSAEWKKIHINESKVPLLCEDVYASNKKGRNKIQISYKKRPSDSGTKNFGSLNPNELLNTGKMDQDNSDTYEVPLKGGIVSYNITSIRGTAIMHYFKNKFAKMDLDLDGDGEKESYELFMENDEYQQFFRRFYAKINYVVSRVCKELYNKSNGKIEFSGVSICPVPSSSGFNTMVAKQLAEYTKINGLKVVDIDAGMFRKDLANLKKDEEFIDKNKEYYSSKMFDSEVDDISHEGYVDKTLNRLSKVQEAKPYIDEYNKAFKQLNTCYANRDKYGDKFGQALARFYQRLYDAFRKLNLSVKRMRKGQVFSKLKGTKSHVVARKSEEIWEIVKPYLRGTKVTKMELHYLQPSDFEIKNLSNDVRMGMKNYFAANDDVAQREMEKIKGTIFVIFDDNISGGATLSDMCMQAKKLGIEYIVPITFGEMQQKYYIGRNVIKPSKSGRFEHY